jgi:transcriptional regulator GlxA family with amidase domain
MSQRRLTGRIVALDAVWSRWTRETADAVAGAGTPARELDVFERALERLLSTEARHDKDPAIAAALRAMRARGRPVNVDVFAHAAGIGRRQFERRFRDRVGLSPNLFGRIVRFQHAFAALGHEPGALLAARLGYVDQAHLIREVRRFSGRTPTLLADASGLTSFFANAASP